MIEQGVVEVEEQTAQAVGEQWRKRANRQHISTRQDFYEQRAQIQAFGERGWHRMIWPLKKALQNQRMRADVARAEGHCARRCKLWRIANDHVVATLASRLVQHLDGIGAFEDHALVEAVQRRALGADLQRERARVNRVHFTRAAAGRRERDGSHEAVRIEYTQAAR